MDPLLNPFVPGAGSRPPALVGRGEDLDKVRLLISRLSLGRQQRSLLLTGLRGVGKTVLLNEFESLANDAGWATAMREVPSEHLVFKDLIAESVRKTLIRIGKERGLEPALKRAFGALRSFRPKVSASMGASGSIEYSLSIESVDGVADSGNVSEDLSDLLEEVGLAARARSTGVLLLFDEVQNLSKSDLEALIMALHRVSQKNVPVAVVAAGLPTLPTLATEAASYAERLFEFRRLDRLDRKDAGLALTLPSEPVLSWTSEALKAALDEADGYPYFLQEWGQKVWDVTKSSPVRASDVRSAREVVIYDLDHGFFLARHNRAAALEKSYMRIMAAAPSLPCRSGDVVLGQGKLSANALSTTRDRLIRRGLIYSPRHGEVDFTVPGFAAFLRRNPGV